ncbi:DUF3098 domain-containing protein [Parabacteroides sp. 52]|uniref:DUF3098 domain-containing protein n=1 Tax=unclassified Parabacteroides TaxID=2649774 RepID=UPI0013D4C141|nr:MULTISPECIES: DUF3098 domain-containing protein [unclassified Parabacteroides]MDH6534175.1 putative membrane protein [Parabacteroides sp. PM5-20]NDV54923.1 DUF3098 domain-containing protein [Parabacteroides sp. 52]
MAKKDFAFGKENFILIAIAIAVIVIGFVLMSGGGSEDGVTFNPEIFGARRIIVAPVVTIVGFILMVVGILKNSKNEEVEE